MLTTTRWRLLDRAVELKRHLQLAANSAHHSPFFLFIRWYSFLAHFDQYSLNAEYKTMQEWFFLVNLSWYKATRQPQTTE